MSKTPLVYIEHILDSIDNIEQFLVGYNKDNLVNDRMRYDAILRNLQIMAESVQRLPKDLYNEYPDIPWKNIIGFRNILVHDYLEGIDCDIIWTITQNELPKLKNVIIEIKQNMKE